MSEPFVGEIKMVGFNFAPRGYAQCWAQLLPITQNSALFSLLGTTFGGDGRVTFGLPDLRGRAPVGFGAGPGLSPVDMGEVGGVDEITLSQAQMPVHVHTATTSIAIPAVGASTNVQAAPATNTVLGPVTGGGRPGTLYSTDHANTTLLPFTPAITVGPAGSSLPVPLASPYLGINFVIALIGIFPSRN